MHSVPASPQLVPAATWLGRQAPAPLQVSAESHCPDDGSPQAVPELLNPLSWQAPESSQVSWLTHSVPASPQSVPAVTWLGRQAPAPLQVSALSHWPDDGSPHAVPADLNPLSWQAPEPSQVSWFVHSVPASPQLVPAATWLGWQVPEPLQVSAESHWPDEGSPHAVPTDLNPLSWQAPELSQVSWLTHSVPASPQVVPAVTWLDWQIPEPLQVSGESHCPDEESPHAVPELLNPLSWQAPELSQVSWFVHSVPASPQSVPAATWLGWQVPEPLQVSGESHWPAEGSPHAVPTDLNPLSWQAPELSQVSWLTHSVPASPQVVPAVTWLGWQVPEPLQVSGESHCPDEGSPQAVPELLNPLSWQAPELSQVSWLTHSVPASPQSVPAATWLGWQVPEPLQVSGLSHCPDEESPQPVPEALKPLSWQAPELSQVSWLTHSVPASPQLVPAAVWLGWQVPEPLQVSGLSHCPDEESPQPVPEALKPL